MHIAHIYIYARCRLINGRFCEFIPFRFSYWLLATTTPVRAATEKPIMHPPMGTNISHFSSATKPKDFDMNRSSFGSKGFSLLFYPSTQRTPSGQRESTFQASVFDPSFNCCGDTTTHH